MAKKKGKQKQDTDQDQPPPPPDAVSPEEPPNDEPPNDEPPNDDNDAGMIENGQSLETTYKRPSNCIATKHFHLH